MRHSIWRKHLTPKSLTFRRCATLALAGVASGFAGVVWCADPASSADVARDYPNRPIRLIAQFQPGTTTDIMARLIGLKLTEAWGQQVVIDNRPGAGGTLGTEIA